MVLYIQAQQWQKAYDAALTLEKVYPSYPDLQLKKQAILGKIEISR